MQTLFHQTSKGISMASLLLCSVLATGCVGIVPIPASPTKVENGKRITAAQASMVKAGQTTRAEVVEVLGSRYISMGRDRAIAYSWEMKGGGYAWWFMPVTPAGGADMAGGAIGGGWRAYFVAFDEQGVVRATSFRSPSMRRSLHEHLENWVKKLP